MNRHPYSATIAKTAPAAALPNASGGLLQRACACGQHTPGGGECAGCNKQRLGLQRQATRQDGPQTVPPIVHEVLRSPGQPLDAATRTYMEPRFGHAFSRVPARKLQPAPAGELQVGPADDQFEWEARRTAHRIGQQPTPAGAPEAADFSTVRVHTGSKAEESARSVGALAYTVGSHIVFGAEQYAPETPQGRWLIAHELAHTIQQSQGDLSIQRFVPCTRARLSLEECPKREPGEERKTAKEPMIVEYITSPEVGYLIANFDVGKSELKASVKRHPNWPQMVKTISEPNSQWKLWGLSDCHGAEQLNQKLRKKRADKVLAALPSAAAAHIVGSSDASLGDCITDNENMVARQWNRSVLITAFQREMNFEPIDIEGTSPIPKPVKQSTEDCDVNEQDALARAAPLAIAMARRAIGAISSQTAESEALLKKYFGKDAHDHRYHIQQNFASIRDGLKWGPTYQCHEQDSWWCDGAYAKVIPIVGINIHICPSAIARGDDFLARTLIHEAAHGFAFLFGEEICEGGCPSSMDSEDAEDNADSYGEFAGDAFVQQL